MTVQDTFDFASRAVARALGVDIVYTREGEDPVTTKAVLGDGFDRVRSGEVRVSSRRLEITLTLSDFPFSMEPDDARGDAVTIGSRSLVVGSLQPHVEGVSALAVLKQAS